MSHVKRQLALGVLCIGSGVFGWVAPCRAVTVSLARSVPSEVRSQVQFEAAATGNEPLSYTWDFGDGTRIGPVDDSQITHEYAAAGHYPVIVIAQDDTGVRSDSFVHTVHNPLDERSPTASSTIVYDAQRERICTVNPDHESVTCLDAASLERSFTSDVQGTPRSLTLDAAGNLWVAVDEPAQVTVIDDSGALSDTLPLGYGAHPAGIVASPDAEHIYVALSGVGELAILETATRTEVGRVPVGPFPTAVAASGDGARIFLSRFISPGDRGEVFEVDPVARRALEPIPLAPGAGPDTEATARGVPNYVRGLAVSPDGVDLWVASKQDNTFRGVSRDGLGLTFETTVRTVLSVVDVAAREERAGARIDLNNRSLGLALTMSPLGDYVFVALLGNNGITVLDAYDGRITGGRSELGLAPDGLALGSDGRLYVHSFLSRTVHVVDVSGVLSGEDFSLPVVGEARTVAFEVLDDAVLLGKQTFYNAADERMTRHGYVSCATCHLDGFEDGRVWDFTDRGEGLRNTTSLLGRRGTGQGPVHWSANFDEIQDFEHDIRNAFGGSGFMSDAEFETGTRNQTLGDGKAGVSAELDALAAYVESLDRVPSSPYRDPDGTLTEQGWRGHASFEQAGCGACHSGPDFTDSPSLERYDVGTLKETSGSRLGDTLDGIDTPTLRGVWQTAPYLHDGSASTLYDAIFVAGEAHGQTADLSESERDDLIAYVLQIDNTAHADETELPAVPDAGPAPELDAGTVVAPVADAASEPSSPLDAAPPPVVARGRGGSRCTIGSAVRPGSQCELLALVLCAGLGNRWRRRGRATALQRRFRP